MEAKRELMNVMNEVIIAELKSTVDWVAQSYGELAPMYQDPWLRQLMELVMLSATYWNKAEQAP